MFLKLETSQSLHTICTGQLRSEVYFFEIRIYFQISETFALGNQELTTSNPGGNLSVCFAQWWAHLGIWGQRWRMTRDRSIPHPPGEKRKDSAGWGQGQALRRSVSNHPPQYPHSPIVHFSLKFINKTVTIISILFTMPMKRNKLK